MYDIIPKDLRAEAELLCHGILDYRVTRDFSYQCFYLEAESWNGWLWRHIQRHGSKWDRLLLDHREELERLGVTNPIYEVVGSVYLRDGRPRFEKPRSWAILKPALLHVHQVRREWLNCAATLQGAINGTVLQR